ncbi:MAG: DUF4974 domain-containing protein [Tannerellaceae bacterium]|jgi:ferric-dicitrate binding protein FerR (iron transport regulator)|nr:DUF4974 domain-containing protein [Tannerellaceae bacterium]
MEKSDTELLLKKAQALGEDIKEVESIDAMQAYERAQVRLRSISKRLIYNRLMRYAAFLTLPLLLTSFIFGYLYFQKPESAETYAEISTSAGIITRYELPDHSVVWLNSGSKLRFPTVFRNDNRNVELAGEAYFEVEANPRQPFYVNTSSGLSLYVYGTKFNVSAYEDDGWVETALEEGKLRVAVSDKKTIELMPGEHLVYDKRTGGVTQGNIDIYVRTAWKDGKLIFRDASLEDIFKQLERRFNVKIEFNNLNGKEYKYRATFRNETLTQILNYLAKSVHLKWHTEEIEQQKNGSFPQMKIIIDLY